MQSAPESPTLGTASRETAPAQTPDQDAQTLRALEGQAHDEPAPAGRLTRRGTFSSRGAPDDYRTDEEDADVLTTTLISFDVDSSESPEPPAGMWSIRPSANPARPAHPVYVVNALTSLPSVLAADFLTNFIAYNVCAAYEAVALRWVARAFARRRGLLYDHVYPLNPLRTFSWRAAVNVFGLETVRLLVSGEMWALVTVVSQWLHLDEEEWRVIHMEDYQAARADPSRAP